MTYRKLIIMLLLSLTANLMAITPIDALLERIDKGASSKFRTELKKGDRDFFELEQSGKKVVVRGNTYVNIAVGINWYLKYYAGINLTWNSMHARLPEKLPEVVSRERHETDLRLRYDFNYCTFSYSMPFWGWERWQEEIDWMALHGINMPLAATGYECVWKRIMERLGYSRKDIDGFIAGPAFLAWWEMNNLEGWGGPNPDSWYEQQEKLQKQILARMRELGMHPVLPGYSGMVPSKFIQQSAQETANEDNGESSISTIQLWNGFTRPGILMPSDPRFQKFADMFYEESQKLFGKAEYYSMDPFHEAKNLPADLDLRASFRAIYDAMRKACGNAVWVCQGWSENPRQEMLDEMKPGEVIFLDLFSECRPMWGAPSIWKKDKGYEGHRWMFCLLENFGANIGLHGRMDQLLDNFYLARESALGKDMAGIGLTMEGSETNPVMYELMCELPWREHRFTKEEWISSYIKARYGMAMDSVAYSNVRKAWQLLIDGIYNCPSGNNQQGAHESIFCSRPSLDCFQASSWSKMQNYYDPRTTEEAAGYLLAASSLKGSDNYEYDLVDVTRQAIADRARIIYNRAIADFKSFDREMFRKDSQEFLRLLLLQDRLLSARSEFSVGRWLDMARSKGLSEEEKDHYEWNARVQITTWGNRYCADTGKLRDYAHKEWGGILKDFYYPRWEKYWKTLEDELDGKLPVLPVGNSSWLKYCQDNPALTIDWYAMEEPWTLSHNRYPMASGENPADVARTVYNEAFRHQ